MLNPNTQQRELAYVAKVTQILPIDGSDNCECAMVGGWHAMVPKNTFREGDLCVCFEYDSLLDGTNPAFAFMERRKYKVKPQKYTFGGKGNFVSDSLVMKGEDFGWDIEIDADLRVCAYIDSKNKKRFTEGDFLTEHLKVTYWEPGDNQRKSNNPNDKYKLMAQRHPAIFRKPFVRWLMRRTWGKKLLFVFFGRKKDKKPSFPAWVKKTDEERIQSMTWILNDKETEWIATEKIDGTSTTFTMLQAKLKKRQMLVCSRNVTFDTPEKESRNYYADTDGNVYLEMADKYYMRDVLGYILDEHPEYKYITIQGETYGGTIQKRKYQDEHKLAIFNYIYCDDDGEHRLNPIEMTNTINQINKVISLWDNTIKLECVPIVAEHFILLNTCDEMLEYAGGESKIDGKEREGLVFRSYDGTKSFKAVDNNFLIKYHSN